MRKNKGGALIIVLVLSACFALICLGAMEMAVLQLKMMQSFSEHVQNRLTAQKKLFTAEKYLASGDLTSEHAAHFLQWVPDSLKFHEPGGNCYYRIQAKDEREDEPSIISTYGVRAPLDQQANDSPWDTEQAPVLEGFLSEPIVVKLPTEQWVKMGVSQAQGNSLTLDILVQANNKILAEINLPFISADHTLSNVLVYPVDAKGRGYCDRVYIAFGQQLVKIDFIQHYWQAHEFHFLEDLPLIKELAVGHHPKGKGVLIYALGQINSHPHIVAIEDNPAQQASFYFKHSIPGAETIKLYQSYLIVATLDKAMVLDAFNGKALAAHAWTSNALARPQPDILHLVPKPAEKKWLLCYQHAGMLKKAEFEMIDKSLGRQTWWEE